MSKSQEALDRQMRIFDKLESRYKISDPFEKLQGKLDGRMDRLQERLDMPDQLISRLAEPLENVVALIDNLSLSASDLPITSEVVLSQDSINAYKSVYELLPEETLAQNEDLPKPAELKEKRLTTDNWIQLLHFLVSIIMLFQSSQNTEIEERKVIAEEEANRIAIEHNSILRESNSIAQEKNELAEKTIDCFESFSVDIQPISDYFKSLENDSHGIAESHTMSREDSNIVSEPENSDSDNNLEDE
jgi:hypothetical protein